LGLKGIEIRLVCRVSSSLITISGSYSDYQCGQKYKRTQR